MPLEKGTKPGSPGFSRNVAEMVNAGHPRAQAVAAAYSAAGQKRTGDAAGSIKVLAGEDPASGAGELAAVPRQSIMSSPVLTVPNVGFPSTAALPEPFPMINPPPSYSNTVHPQSRQPIPTIGGEETAVKVTRDDMPDDMGSGDPGMPDMTGDRGRARLDALKARRTGK